MGNDQKTCVAAILVQCAYCHTVHTCACSVGRWPCGGRLAGAVSPAGTGRVGA